jgi:hypothetical protein
MSLRIQFKACIYTYCEAFLSEKAIHVSTCICTCESYTCTGTAYITLPMSALQLPRALYTLLYQGTCLQLTTWMERERVAMGNGMVCESQLFLDVDLSWQWQHTNSACMQCKGEEGHACIHVHVHNNTSYTQRRVVNRNTAGNIHDHTQ